MPAAIFILDIDADGAVAAHPLRTELPVAVAPIPADDRSTKFDTVRPHLIAIGCMAVPNTGFEFDSSFINPKTEGKFSTFVRLMRAAQGQDATARLPPVSVFGHADPTGDDDYNKHLSGRRALAVYGLLTRNPDIWDELFLKPFGGDRWGLRSMRFILSVIKGPDGQPFFQGEPDGDDPDLDAQTKVAIKAYEAARGLGAGGLSALPSSKTRKAMYLEYMDLLCHEKPVPGQPPKGFRLDPVEHFIARNQDARDHRGDVQGCGEFNPILLISKAEDDLFKSKTEFKQARDAVYAKDRRVLIYIFKHDTEVDIGGKRWPCPPARTQAELCRKRFWSDAKERLALGEDRREFKDEQRTMACRFYHGFARNSPCETGGRLWIVRFHADAAPNAIPPPLKNRRFVLIAGESTQAAVMRGSLDERGEMRIPVFDERATFTVKLDVFGSATQVKDAGSADEPAPAAEETAAGSGFDSDKFPDEDRFVVLKLDAGALEEAKTDLGARQRLYNLGFGSVAPKDWSPEQQDHAVKVYRKSRNLGAGDLEATKEPLAEEHELRDVPTPGPDDPGPVAAPAEA